MRANLILTVFVLSVSFLTPAFSQPVAVQDNTSAGYCAGLENEKIKYFQENKYSEFIDFLNNYKITDQSNKPCINYYQALTRYAQLSYLEEKQSWDEYFANGNDYRQQIVDGVNKVIAQTNASDGLRSKSRLLIWQFHHGQQDAFHEQALIDLMTDVKAYAQASQDTALVKYIADALLSSGQKSSARELYKLYVDKLVEGKMTDAELKNIAAGFYKEQNLELAQTVYDIYIERVSNSLPPDKFIAQLFEIASLFVYKQTGLYDMPYAEKVYSEIEGLGQKNSFDQETIYLRAFNLEKFKDYKMAGEFYSQLVQLYPDTRHFDEAVYKIAMINAYVSADIQKAREYFNKLVAKTAFSPQGISSFYQLGLLAQWEGDLVKAKGYYDALLKNSGDKYAQTVSQTKDRLKEIEENKQLNYNLKTFLDVTLKKENAPVEMGRSELKISSFILEKEQKMTVSAFANMPESGCNQVQVQYLWSGSLGGANPQATDATFQGSYPDSGTKEINMVVVSPAGITDCSFTMLDVY